MTMFAVYRRAYSWGAWGQAERWFLVARVDSRASAERVAQRVGGLVVDESARRRLAA
jgi:hypothetical protein